MNLSSPQKNSFFQYVTLDFVYLVIDCKLALFIFINIIINDWLESIANICSHSEEAQMGEDSSHKEAPVSASRGRPLVAMFYFVMNKLLRIEVA